MDFMIICTFKCLGRLSALQKKILFSRTVATWTLGWQLPKEPEIRVNDDSAGSRQASGWSRKDSTVLECSMEPSWEVSSVRYFLSVEFDHPQETLRSNSSYFNLNVKSLLNVYCPFQTITTLKKACPIPLRSSQVHSWFKRRTVACDMAHWVKVLDPKPHDLSSILGSHLNEGKHWLPQTVPLISTCITACAHIHTHMHTLTCTWTSMHIHGHIHK